MLIPSDLDVINLGSVQPYFAFDYAETGITGMNWALKPQFFEYDYKLLQQYHYLLKENAFVIIPVVVFSFFAFGNRSDYDLIKYYRILNQNAISDYSYKTKQSRIDYPILSAKKSLIRLIKDVPLDNRFMIRNNPLNRKEMEEDAQRRMDYWLQSFSLETIRIETLSKDNQKNINHNIDILGNMIRFCLERKYRPVIMTLPSSKELTKLFIPSFIKRYVSDNIDRANTYNVPIVNYWNDIRFMNSDFYFNSFHLNSTGRREFTKEVIKELKRLA
jgi:hypothetical protein